MSARRPFAERFWEKVDRSGGSDACWPWTACKDPKGYGQFMTIPGYQELSTTRGAHRIAYMLVKGPIPPGLDIDHLCHTHSCLLVNDCPHRACCNPAHLQPKTRSENVSRGNRRFIVVPPKSQCRRGHPFDGINTYRDPTTGRRRCRTCHRFWASTHAKKKHK